MKKILDFYNEHRKVCITLGVVLVVIIAVAVGVAVHISSDRADADKTDKASQTAKITDPQDKESEDSESTENIDVTETENTDEGSGNEGGADHSAVIGASTENNGSQTGGSAKTGESGSSGGSGALPASSDTGPHKSESGASSSGNTGDSHQHVWENHYTTVTVVDQPEQSEKVTEYNMYYWDSKTWQKSEDPNVFKDWQRKKMEWMRTYRYENNMPPELFKGYDANGNPQYTNDHSIVTYYRTVPAVTHEEQRVDYQYCAVCGMRK